MFWYGNKQLLFTIPESAEHEWFLISQNLGTSLHCARLRPSEKRKENLTVVKAHRECSHEKQVGLWWRHTSYMHNYERGVEDLIEDTG